MAGILHATDFSAASGAAFTWAVNMARRDRAELLLLHVLSPPAPLVADAYVTPAVWNTLIRSQRASAQRRLDTLVAKAARAPRDSSWARWPAAWWRPLTARC